MFSAEKTKLFLYINISARETVLSNVVLSSLLEDYDVVDILIP